MALQTVNQIIGSIKAIGEHRQIAVFKPRVVSKKKVPVLDAYVANTVVTQKKISVDKNNYIGSFGKMMNLKEVRAELKRAAKESDLSLSGWEGGAAL